MRLLLSAILLIASTTLFGQVRIFQIEPIPPGYYIGDFDDDGYNDTIRIKAGDVRFLPDPLLPEQTAEDSTVAAVLQLLSDRIDSLATDTLATDVWTLDSLQGPTVQDELTRLDSILSASTSSGAPNAPVRLTAPNIIVDVEYKGATPPTLAGTTGQYTLTEKSGTEIENITLISIGSATAGNACAFTIVSEDMYNRWSTASVFDQAGNLIPVNNRPLGLSQASSAQGSVTITVTEISAFPNFVIFLYR
jgi:hypothetical protein